MKILIIANGYPTNKHPQWGCFEKDQALALQAAGHKVIIMSIDGRFCFYWRKIGFSHIRDNGFEIYNIFWFPLVLIGCINRKWEFAIRHKMALKLYNKIAKEQGRPDILYAHFLYNIASGVDIKKQYGIPLIGMEHWSILNQEKLPRYVVDMGNVAYKSADQIISVSDSLRKIILQQFNRNSIVIHNMVGDIFINKEINCEKNINNGIDFVAVGSLIQRKGFDVLIRAFAESNLKKEGARLTIIGEGEERNNLQQQINVAGLTNNIILEGQKVKTEIVEILHNSDVFVLASRSETFGVVCIEAMATGLPVIATACGGPEEFIDDANGLLVPVNDVEVLAIALKKMHVNIHHYNRKEIADDCREKFSPSVIAGKLTTVFENIIRFSEKR